MTFPNLSEFDGGQAGQAIAPADVGPGVQLVGAAATYSRQWFRSSPLSARFNGDLGLGYYDVTGVPAATVVFQVAYLNLVQPTSGECRIMRVHDASGVIAELRITAAGNLRLANASQTSVALSAYSLLAGPCRIEWGVLSDAGNVQFLQIFSGANIDGTSGYEQVSGNVGRVAVASSIRFGMIATPSGIVEMDHVGVGTATAWGPYVPPEPPISGGLARTLTRVNIAGIPFDLSSVLAEWSASHGRQTVTDGPTASAAVVRVLDPVGDYARRVDVGGPMFLASDDGPVFTGSVTDLQSDTGDIYDAAGHDAYLSVLGIGELSRLGRSKVGDEPWPVETVGTRVMRILTLSGVGDYSVSGGQRLSVYERDVNARYPLELLAELTDDNGAAVFDEPDGTIVFQAHDARTQSWKWQRWLDMSGPWTAVVGSWSEQYVESDAAPRPVRLPAKAVLYSPAWRQHLSGMLNIIRVRYGLPEGEGMTQAEYRLTAPGSVARFGDYEASMTTQLATEADASFRAQQLLSRMSVPRWSLQDVAVRIDRLPDEDRPRVLSLICGGRVIVEDMPTGGPGPSWLGMVEGWSDAASADEWTRTFSCSDLSSSSAGVAWSQLDPDVSWLDCNPVLPWYDVLTSDSLTGVYEMELS